MCFVCVCGGGGRGAGPPTSPDMAPREEDEHDPLTYYYYQEYACASSMRNYTVYFAFKLNVPGCVCIPVPTFQRVVHSPDQYHRK